MQPIEIFARGVWQIIPRDDDVTWVRRVAESPEDQEPCGDYGAIVRRMLELGVSESDIARLARIIGYEVAFGLCYHLGDPRASYEAFDDDQPEYEWDLFRTEGGNPIESMFGVHEVLLSGDPTGKEMRPTE